MKTLVNALWASKFLEAGRKRRPIEIQGKCYFLMPMFVDCVSITGQVLEVQKPSQALPGCSVSECAMGLVLAKEL